MGGLLCIPCASHSQEHFHPHTSVSRQVLAQGSKTIQYSDVRVPIPPCYKAEILVRCILPPVVRLPRAPGAHSADMSGSVHRPPTAEAGFRHGVSFS